MTDQTTLDRLAEHFPTSAHKKVSKGAGNQTYVPWTDAVERMNDVLGADWSFRVVREGLTDTEAWVLGEITATIDGVVCVRQHYGCESINKGQRGVADLFKIAASDAIRKAATLIGVGMYLSIKEEREEIEAAMREEVQEAIKRERVKAETGAWNRPDPKGAAATPAAKPRPQASQPASTPTASGAAPTSSSTTGTSAPLEPTPLKTKLELVAQLKEGIEYAKSLGLDPNQPDVTKMNRADIEDVIEDLRKQCRQVKSERKKQTGAA